MQSCTSFIIRRIKAKEKSQTKWKKDASDAAADAVVVVVVVVTFAAFKDSHLIQMNFIFNSDFSLSCFVRLSVNYDWAEMMPTRLPFVEQIPPLSTARHSLPSHLPNHYFVRSFVSRFPTTVSGTNKWVARSHSLTYSLTFSVSQSVCRSVRTSHRLSVALP